MENVGLSQHGGLAFFCVKILLQIEMITDIILKIIE